MASRDLNDRHRAGELDMDVGAEPLEIDELPLEEAEDMWLSVIALTPARLDYTRVVREHLSHRARIILEIIRATVAGGWPQVAAEHLTGGVAESVRLKYWAALKQKPQDLDLRSVPGRLRNFAPEDVPLEVAEDALIRSWHKAKYTAVHHYVAQLAQEQGVEAADDFLTTKTARMAALTCGVKWRTFGEVAGQYIDQLRDKLQNPQADSLIGTGFSSIDRMVRFWGPRKFTVVAGWNGHGKSTIIAQLLSQMAVNGVPTVYISGEDEMLITVERILTWLVADLAVAKRLSLGEPQGPKIDGYTINDVYSLDKLMERARDLPLRMLHLPNAPLGQVCAAIVDGARHGARVGAHDYLGTVEMPSSYDVTDWRNKCVRTIKASAISNGMHWIEGAQLVRPKERDEKSRPTRYMIGNCPAAEEAADYVILVWRKFKGQTMKSGGQELPVDFEEAYLIVDKSKDSKTGVVRCAWDTARHRFDYQPEDAVQTNLADRAYATATQEDPHVDDF